MTPTRPLPDLVTPERLRELLLDPAADADCFVVPHDVDASASPAFRRAVGLAQFYASRSLAASTRDSYAAHWRSFLKWCALAGEEPLGGPDVVAAHLALLAAGTRDDDDQLVEGDHGRPRQRPLTTATIDLRLAAINKAYDLLGLPAPGAHPFTKRVKAGIHRELGVGSPHRKAALTLERLRPVLAATGGPAPEAVRDLVGAALWWHGHLSARALSRLVWEDLDAGRLGGLGACSGALAPAALGPVSVAGPCHPAVAVPALLTGRALGQANLVVSSAASASVPPPGGRGAGASRDLAFPRTFADLLGHLRALSGGRGPVLSRVKEGAVTGVAMSDAGVLKMLRRVLSPVAGGAGDPLVALAHRPPGALARAAERLLVPPAIDVRDRAMLLCGFAAAVRRSNLVGFEWRDFGVHPEGLVVTLRRSKTDQEGRGFELFVPYGQHELTCPVRAWAAWRGCVAAAIGADPCQVAADQPVFVGIDRHGHLHRGPAGELLQLRDDSFNEVVQSRCRRAGLVGDFGAHSLRAGFVTTAVDAGVSLHEIAEQTNHRSIEALRVYIRRIQSATNSPLRHLAM